MMESMERAPLRRRVRMGKMLPKFEGPTVSTSIRMPAGMRDEIKKVSEKTGHPTSEVIIYFLRWALQEWDADQEAEREKKASRR